MKRCILFGIVLMGVHASHVHGQTSTWRGLDATWLNNANWSSGEIPGIAPNVGAIFPISVTAFMPDLGENSKFFVPTVEFLNSYNLSSGRLQIVDSLSVSTGSTATFSTTELIFGLPPTPVSMVLNGTLTNQAPVQIGYFSLPTPLTISGSGAGVWNVYNFFNVINGSSITFTNPCALNFFSASSTNVGYQSSITGSSVTVTQSGGEFTTVGAISVGRTVFTGNSQTNIGATGSWTVSPNNTLTIQDGATVNNAGSIVIDPTGNANVLNIDANSSLISSGSISFYVYDNLSFSGENSLLVNSGSIQGGGLVSLSSGGRIVNTGVMNLQAIVMNAEGTIDSPALQSSGQISSAYQISFDGNNVIRLAFSDPNVISIYAQCGGLLNSCADGISIAAGCVLQIDVSESSPGNTYTLMNTPGGISGAPGVPPPGPFSLYQWYQGDLYSPTPLGLLSVTSNSITVTIPGSSTSQGALSHAHTTLTHSLCGKHTANMNERLFSSGPLLAASYRNNQTLVAQDDSIWDHVEYEALLAQQRVPEQLAERSVEAPSKPWAVYFGPTGSFGSIPSEKIQVGNHHGSVGGFAGFDYAWPNLDGSCSYGIGTTFHYTRYWGTLDRNVGSFHEDIAYNNVYATFVPRSIPELSVNAIVGGGYCWYDQKRNTGAVTEPLVAHSTTGGPLVNGLLGLEYAFSRSRYPSMKKDLRVIPIVSLQYVYSSLGSYAEHGAGIFDMQVGRQTDQGLWSFLGFRTNWVYACKQNFSFRPEILAGWQYKFFQSFSNVRSATINNPLAQSSIFSSGYHWRNTLFAGADLRFTMYKNYFLQFDYDVIYNSHLLENSFRLQFNVDF